MNDEKIKSHESKIKLILPYVGIPILTVLFLILHGIHMVFFVSVLYVLVIILGYITALIDFKSKRIPNKLMIVMLAAWVVVIFPVMFFNTDPALVILVDSAVGFLLGGGIFLLVYVASRKGLGGGDVKFMALTGLYLGFGGIIPAMLYGTILAGLTGLVLILAKKIGRKDTIPLAPFLYIGILITIFWR